VTSQPLPQVGRRVSGAVDLAVCEPFEAAMLLLGRRWAGGVARALLDGAERYGEIRTRLPGVTDAVLTARLRELCAWGIVRRVESTEGPPRYRLTDAGRDLAPVIEAVEHYGSRHRDLLRRLRPATG
jgi:DNA-binding HxlR family transcriptional regulator